LLTVPGYELYQLAHLTTVAVDALARRRLTVEQRDHLARRVAAASGFREPPSARPPSAEMGAAPDGSSARIPTGFW
jgi:hypothetical protein